VDGRGLGVGISSAQSLGSTARPLIGPIKYCVMFAAVFLLNMLWSG
jgi:hypothetical protein